MAHGTMKLVGQLFNLCKSGGQWHNICLFADLFNREIISFSADKHKNAELVYQALATTKTSLNNIQLFHTDRGHEFDHHFLL